MTSQTYKIIWQGIEIEARYEHQSCCADFAHLELKSINPPKARLPMTETGYRSHFHAKGLIENHYDGDVVAFVTQWLNAESKSKKWQGYVEDSKQLALF